MAEAFDPYRKWLGIPPEDQPPHHYRLLGIETFETDADVIANAVDGRMSQVKNYQTGKFSALSQKILNEIAAARVCLLNPQKKTAYDEALRQRLEGGDAGIGSSRNGGVIGAGVPQFEDPAAAVATYVSRRGKPRPKWQLPAALIGVGLVIIAFLIYQIANSDTAPVAVHSSSTAGHSSDRPLDGMPSSRKPPVGGVPEEPPAADPSPESPAMKPVEPNDTPKPEDTSQKPSGDSATGEEQPTEQPDPGRTLADMVDPGDSDAEEPGDGVGPSEEPAPAGPKRLPVPGAEERRVAEAKIREIFQNEFAEAKSAEQLQALAELLLNQASQTPNDPTARFTLMQLATQELIKADAVAEALAAVDEMARTFDIRPLGIKAYYLDGWLKAAGRASEDTSKAVTQTAMALAEESAAADDYATAGRFVKIATAAARKTRDLATIRQINLRRRDFETMETKYAATKEALDVLATDPNNAEANLTAGRWYCFVKDNWKKGLPYLARSSDAPLAVLAKQDLAVPKTAKAQVALADDWWDLAEKQGEDAKSQLQSRAEKWYREALPKLASLEKVRVEKRLEELAVAEAEPVATGSSVRGVVQKGNVALASNGTKVLGTVENAIELIDGKLDHDTKQGFAVGPMKSPWMIVFAKTYRILELRLLLWNLTPRLYNYRIDTSVDGKQFEPLVDRSVGEWGGGWQRFEFPPRSVRYIRIFPIEKRVPGSPTVIDRFTVVELQAYCISPDP